MFFTRRSMVLYRVVMTIVLLSVSLSCSKGDVMSVISGTAMYEDREYGSGGFTFNTSYKPVRHARVEVVNTVTSSVLATGVTNASGEYEIVFPHAPGINAYVRVIASTSGTGIPSVDVLNQSGFSTYAVAGNALYLDPGVYRASFVNVPASGPAGGAFNILDVMTAAGQFVNSLSGTMPPPLDAYWTEGGNAGTYYDFSGGIHVLGLASDTDEYDDDVLWHEYGHFAADTYSIEDSPGGAHDFSMTDLDLRLSWSEGWSNYFQSALKDWLKVTMSGTDLSGVLSVTGATPTTYYVDTDSGGTRNSLDIASAGSSYVYSSNEIAVAKILHELAQFSGTSPVWAVFNSVAGYLLPSEQSTLEAFWDGWVDTEGPSPIANAIIIDREIYYLEDAFEPDGLADSQRLLLVNDSAGEEHYLYDSLSLWDTDYLAFNATSTGDYTVETFCMRNGADTYLEVLGTDQSTLVNSPSDDDFIPGTCPPDKFTQYSSRVIANISSPGIYYAVVNTSTALKILDPPNIPYPGRYGTYRIRVTGP